MRALFALAAACLAFASAAGAAELKVLSTMAMRSVMEEMIPQFERASGHKVTIVYDTANIMAKRLQDGAAADLVVLTPALVEQLAKEGRVVTGSNVTLARSGVGIAIRAGAPKPDLSNAAVVKRALLEAKSIAYTATGQSGTYFASLIEKMGITAEVKAKARIPAGGSTGELVAKNEAEMAVQQIPELMATPGIQFVGPLPPEIQYMTVFSAGVVAKAAQPGAAEAFIRFLGTPAAASVIRAKGMEP